MIKINNRRYIGSKAKLVKKIYCEVENLVNGDYTFADIFSGTGIVAYEFAKNGKRVIINDTLYSNYVSYNAWFSCLEINFKKINEIINYLNALEYKDIPENYFSNVYSGKYYSLNDSKKIGFIRDYIESIKEELNQREYFYLLTSLMYVSDKIANTVGHFEHFLKRTPKDTNFNLELLDIDYFKNVQIYKEDANELAKKITAEVVYIDPPYNARQYVNFYHVLENLMTWQKPNEFEGTSMKFKRNHLKSGYSRVGAVKLFSDLICNLDAKVIVVSYNNTYKAKSTASNNRIKAQDIINILENKGIVTIKEIEHSFFNSGKTKFSNHKEILYICEVRENNGANTNI